MSSPIRWKDQIGFVCAVLAMLAVGVVAYRAREASLERDRWVQHTQEVLGSLQDVFAAVKSLESAARGYTLTGDESYLDHHQSELASLSRSEAAFRDLTVDNPVQTIRATAIEALAARKVQRVHTIINIRRTQGLDAARDYMRPVSGVAIMRELEGQIGAARDEETRLLALRRAASDRQERWTSTLLAIGMLSGLLVAGMAGWSIHRDGVRRSIIETSLRDEKERFLTLANNISQMTWMADGSGNIFWLNERWFEFTGFTAEDMAGSDWRERVHHPDHMQRVIDKIGLSFKAGTEWEDTFPLRGRDGAYRWFLSRAVPIRDPQGKVLRWFGTSTDITDGKRLEDEVFETRERAQVTLNSIGDAVACTDIDGNITFINLVAETLTGWTWQDAVGQPMATVLRIVNGVTRETIQNPMERAATLDRTMALPPNSVLIRRDGFETPIADSVAPIHDREGKVTGAVIVFRDVSATRALEVQMAHSARHDFLTGLPNRMLLTDRIGQAIAIAPRHVKKVAVLFLDLDGFKAINDTLGHAMGDGLLQSIAARLQGCVRASDTVARLGGDEFVALLSEVDGAEDAALCARRMLKAVAAPHIIDEHQLMVTTSIGISLWPDDGADATSLLSNADVAMYAAKKAGRQAFRFYAPRGCVDALLQFEPETPVIPHELDPDSPADDQYLAHPWSRALAQRQSRSEPTA